MSQPLVTVHRGGTNSRIKRLQPQPPHTRGTFHRRLQPLFSEKHRRFRAPASSPKPTPWHATCMQPLQCDPQPERFKKRIELRTHEQPLVAEHRGGTNSRNETTAAATAAHTRYLSSPAASTLHGKMQGFVLRLPPQSQPHATCMQPLQCLP